MKKNYEIKCKIHNYKAAADLIRNFKKYSFSVEKQTDIYYKVTKGRLKLRIINDESANLIFYDREEKTGRRISKYIISGTVNFKELDEILRKQFEVMIVVQKNREIFIHKNIRIHLDSVKALGKFLEIEIIYQNFSDAEKALKRLIKVLKLDENSFIKESYSDLLIKNS